MIVHWYWVKKCFNELQQAKKWFDFFFFKLYLGLGFFSTNVSRSYNTIEEIYFILTLNGLII